MGDANCFEEYKKNKSKILFILKVPPPKTGATLMNLLLYNNKKINSEYDTRYILVSYSNSIANMGEINVRKVFLFISTIIRLIYEVLRMPDLVYLQLSPTGSAFFRDSIYILLLKLFRRKIILHLRGKGIRDRVQGNYFLRFYYRGIFKNTYVICLSNLLVDDISLIYDRSPLIVNNCVNTMKGYKGKQYKEFKNRSIKLLFVSNLILSKGIIDFVEAIYLLKTMNCNIFGMIVGAEADMNHEDLKHLLIKYGIEDIVRYYYGALYNESKYQVYQKADIFIFPTYSETWGNVVTEAMYFELPVITTREGSLPVIVSEDKTGVFVDSHSPQQIADAVIRISSDYQLYKQMANCARKRVLENYSVSKYEQNMISVFNNVISDFQTSQKYNS